MNTRLLAASFLLVTSNTLLGASCADPCPKDTEHVEVQGKRLEGVKYAEDGYLCLARNPKVIGQPILGTYEYDASGTFGAPRVVLARDGKGTFQKHGVTPQEMTWGVGMKTDGAPAGAATEHGAQLLLFYQLTSVGETGCTPGLICDENNKQTYPADDLDDWSVASLTMSFKSDDPERVQKMWILGEREKRCADGDNDGIAECTHNKDMDAPNF